MARFTSIGMPKKSFVASAAEEAHTSHEPKAGGPSTVPSSSGGAQPVPKKRKRRGTRGKILAGGEGGLEPAAVGGSQQGWSRDPKLATRMSAKLAEDRRLRRQDDKNSSTTCFACRSVGHAARDCPNVLLALEKGAEGSADILAEGNGGEEKKGKGAQKGMKRKPGKKGGDIVGGKCYRCNASDHSLGNCPEELDPTNPTPFATCYICLGSGHLSSLCPSNPGRGIYVNGGSCKVCGSTAHRAKDCPVEAAQKREQALSRSGRGEIVLGVTMGNLGADEDDFMVESREYLRATAGGQMTKNKKHPPANNGQRGPKAMYEKARDVDQGQGEGESSIVAELERPQAQAGEEHQPKPKQATAAVPPKGKARKVVAF